MAGDMNTPLKFDEIDGGEPITIAGNAYVIRHPDSLSLVDYKAVEFKLPRLGRLMAKWASLTDDETKEATTLLASVVDVILDAPSDVKAKLTDVRRIKILDRFTTLRSAELAPAAEAKTSKTRARQRTGRTSSRN